MELIDALAKRLAEDITLYLVEEEATRFEHLTYSIVYETAERILKETFQSATTTDECLDKFVKVVGEAGTMPGTSGFTMACFQADVVPVGTKLALVPDLEAMKAYVISTEPPSEEKRAKEEQERQRQEAALERMAASLGKKVV